MKEFDMCKQYVVYHQIGDTIYARSATAEDYRQKGSNHLQQELSRPEVKTGEMIPLYNLCLLQMELLPREQQLLKYPIFPADDLDIHAMYALTVWAVAMRGMLRGVRYPKEALYLAEKAARSGEDWLKSTWWRMSWTETFL